MTKPRLIVIYTHTLYCEVTPNHDLHTYFFIVKPRLIVIYTYTLYREATPNRYLCTYSLS